MTGAQRMAASRQRRRDGDCMARFLIPAAVARELVDLGWLKPGANVVEVREALRRMMNEALERGVRPRALPRP